MQVLHRLLGKLGLGDRTGPPPGGGVVEEYLKAYRFLGQGVTDLDLEGLYPLHYRLNSNLHREAGRPGLVPSALLYPKARLPGCLYEADRILLMGDQAHLPRPGEGRAWQEVQARARRRKAFFDGRDTLAFIVTSVTDIDDLVPALCAYQVEWNKMHRLLAGCSLGPMLAANREEAFRASGTLRRALGLGGADFQALKDLLGRDWHRFIARVAAGSKKFLLTMLPMCPGDFQRAASSWWDNLSRQLGGLSLEKRPVYLVTSNNHALANLVSGFAPSREKEILSASARASHPGVARAVERWEWSSPGARQNLLYYLLRFLEQCQPRVAGERREAEISAGLVRLPLRDPLLLEAQVLELARLRPGLWDPRLRPPHPGTLSRSPAVILNLDYPLGLGAGHIMEEAGRRLPDWKGLFMLGKSAAMIGRLGDILIPGQVLDAHTGSLFVVKNSLGTRHLLPFLENIAVFDQQKSYTAYGTFMHGWQTIKDQVKQDFTGIEMEAGPALSSLYRFFHGREPREGQRLTVETPPGFSLGILHYTSDTPYNLRASLLSKQLGITGLEGTYAGALAILQYILDLESQK